MAKPSRLRVPASEELEAALAELSPVEVLHAAHAALNEAIDHLERRGEKIPAIASHCVRMRQGLTGFVAALSDFVVGLSTTDSSRRPRDGAGPTLRERLEAPHV